jgi:hypothetical protein
MTGLHSGNSIWSRSTSLVFFKRVDHRTPNGSCWSILHSYGELPQGTYYVDHPTNRNCDNTDDTPTATANAACRSAETTSPSLATSQGVKGDMEMWISPRKNRGELSGTNPIELKFGGWTKLPQWGLTQRLKGFFIKKSWRNHLQSKLSWMRQRINMANSRYWETHPDLQISSPLLFGNSS